MVNELAERSGARFRRARFLPLPVAETRHDSHRLLLLRPETFMNESGPPAASYAKRVGVSGDRIVACHDEIELPLGALKVKFGGSTAGHNGLNSLVQALRGPDFYRVRLGVGRPPGREDPTEWVLSPFSTREREVALALVQDAADAVLSLVTDGLDVTMARYNRGGDSALLR